MNIENKMLMAEIQSVIDEVRSRQAEHIERYKTGKIKPVCYREMSVPTVAIYTEDGVKTMFKIESKLETAGDTKHLVITSVKELDPNADRSKLSPKVRNALQSYEGGLYDNNWAQVTVDGSTFIIDLNSSAQDDLALLTERMVIVHGEETGTYEQCGFTWSAPLFQSSLTAPKFYASILDHWVTPIVKGIADDDNWSYSYCKNLRRLGGIRVNCSRRNAYLAVRCRVNEESGHVHMHFNFHSDRCKRVHWAFEIADINAVPDADDEKMFECVSRVLTGQTLLSCDLAFPYDNELCDRYNEAVIPKIYCGSLRNDFLFSLQAFVNYGDIVAGVRVKRIRTEGEKTIYRLEAGTKLTKDTEEHNQEASEYPDRIADVYHYTLHKRVTEIAVDEMTEGRVASTSLRMTRYLMCDAKCQFERQHLLEESHTDVIVDKDTENVPVYNLGPVDLDEEDNTDTTKTE